MNLESQIAYSPCHLCPRQCGVDRVAGRTGVCGETAELRDVRFRTVGDVTCTCPVASLAGSAAEVVIETLATDVSERGATRMDDRTSDASMENRKKEGYF